jgi:hypothetical protein
MRVFKDNGAAEIAVMLNLCRINVSRSLKEDWSVELVDPVYWVVQTDFPQGRVMPKHRSLDQFLKLHDAGLSSAG